MSTSLLVFTINEAESIEKTLKEIPQGVVDEILIVDGHSTDGTIELVQKMGYPVYLQKEKGFGSAVKEGVMAAKGDIAVTFCSDGSYDPKDIKNLLDKIGEGCDIAMASRYLPGSGSADDSFLHAIGNRILTFLCNMIHGSHFSDCLYFFFAIRKNVFNSIEAKSPGFEYCMEFPIKIHKAGLKICQIPSFERKRLAGRAKVSALPHGWKIFKMIFKA